MISINLLSPELKLARIEAKRNASMISVCIVLILVVIIITIIGQSLKSTVTGYLASATTDVKKNADQLDELKELQELAYLINDRAKITDQINEKRVIWSQVIQELANSAPTGLEFTSINANAEKSPGFVLQGSTTTEREVIKFKEKLENSQLFRNVNFKSSSLQKAEEGKPERLDFTLEFDLEKRSVNSAVSGFSTVSPNGMKDVK